jgi:predicted DNA-binding transcriptional regulator YafY
METAESSENDSAKPSNDVGYRPKELRVAPEVAHYFTRRALLPQQQQRADADGSLLVTTHINHPNQLLPVVRYWLPHVRIVQPAQLQEDLIDNLRQAIKKMAFSENHPSTHKPQ